MCGLALMASCMKSGPQQEQTQDLLGLAQTEHLANAVPTWLVQISSLDAKAVAQLGIG